MSDQQRFKRIHVVANPAAGQDEPVLATLNSVFEDVKWDVSVTNESGDAVAAARQAVADGADVVAAYGGDGTVMEVAEGLLGSDVPLAILPGGTANVLARDLGVPVGLAEAAAIVTGDHALRPLDVGESCGQHFVLRLAVGLEAEMDIAADRDRKDRFGMLAYPIALMEVIRQAPVAHYTITVDGERHEADGVMCVVANSGSFGVGQLGWAGDIDVSDGLLDVLVLESGQLGALLQVAADVVKGQESTPAVHRWRAKTVRIEADPPQRAVRDGEPAGTTPVEARVMPAAVQVVVPVA